MDFKGREKCHSCAHENICVCVCVCVCVMGVRREWIDTSAMIFLAIEIAEVCARPTSACWRILISSDGIEMMVVHRPANVPAK